MFEAKLSKAELMKKIVEAIKDLVQDAPFDCSEAGIALQAMDSSHVALVSLKLDQPAFEDYRCDRTQSLGVSLATLSKILKCSSADDTFTLRYEENGDTATIVFDDTKKDKQQECQMKLMDIDQEHLGIPEQEYACKITMPSAEFKKVVTDLAIFTDSMVITVTKGSVQFQGKGDSGTHSIRFGQSGTADNESGVSIELTEPVNTTFAIKYMQNFVKATPLSATVKLSMSAEVPIVVEYPIEDYGYLRYYLAPKIDDEDMPDN